jgi:hypothetical protein
MVSKKSNSSSTTKTRSIVAIRSHAPMLWLNNKGPGKGGYPPRPFVAEIMQQPWPAQSKKGFWDLLPGKNPQKFLFLEPNPLVDSNIAQASLKK